MIRENRSILALAAIPALKGEIIALRAIANGALGEKELPKRIKLLNWGPNETVSKGIVKVGPNTAALLPVNQEAMGFDQIALDFNHNSLPGHPNYQPDPRHVAGYAPLEVVPGDGLYMTALSYTPDGNSFARDYRDLSPSVLLDDSGEVIFCHSVALCPQGEVKGLSFFSVDVGKALPSPQPKTKTKNPMDYKKLLCLMLGLDPNSATDADIEAAAEKFGKEEKTEPAHKGDKPGEGKGDGDGGGEGNGEGEEPGEGVGEKQIKALSIQISELTKVVGGLVKNGEESERGAILADAMRSGKMVPLSVRKLPIEHLRAVVAELPENVVPTDQRTPEGITALSAGQVVPINSEADKIDQALGITKDMKEKYLK